MLKKVFHELRWVKPEPTYKSHIIIGSYVTTTRKPQFSEEDPLIRVESSKFRPMFAGVNVSFHLYSYKYY